MSSIVFLFFIFTQWLLVKAAPTEKFSYVQQSFIVPDEAVDQNLTISDDQVPLIAEVDGKKYVLIVNGTTAEDIVSKSGIDIDEVDESADDALSKREAKFHWLKSGYFQPNLKKREASPEAKFHWLKSGYFQPNLKKREASPEAKFHWLKSGYFQPNLKKREASPEAKFHWLKSGYFQPNLKKREASPEAKFHWLKYGYFQPNLKKREASPEAKFHWLKYGYFQPNL